MRSWDPVAQLLAIPLVTVKSVIGERWAGALSSPISGDPVAQWLARRIADREVSLSLIHI